MYYAILVTDQQPARRKKLKMVLRRHLNGAIAVVHWRGQACAMVEAIPATCCYRSILEDLDRSKFTVWVVLKTSEYGEAIIFERKTKRVSGIQKLQQFAGLTATTN